MATVQHTETPAYYMANAVEELKRAEKKNGFYTYPKYVKGGSNYAYLAMLLALDPLLPPKKGRREIGDYTAAVAKLSGPTRELKSAYETLHKSGGYDGNLDAVVIARGIDLAKRVIAWAEKMKIQQAKK